MPAHQDSSDSIRRWWSANAYSMNEILHAMLSEEECIRSPRFSDDPSSYAICRVLEEHVWQLTDRQQQYGRNEMLIPVQSVASIIADEMWHPFYVFQYFSIIIWVAGDAYYTYAICIGLITWFSIVTSAYETHQNMKRLADIAHFSSMVGPISTMPLLLHLRYRHA